MAAFLLSSCLRTVPGLAGLLSRVSICAKPALTPSGWALWCVVVCHETRVLPNECRDTSVLTHSHAVRIAGTARFHDAARFRDRLPCPVQPPSLNGTFTQLPNTPSFATPRTRFPTAIFPAAGDGHGRQDDANRMPR